MNQPFSEQLRQAVRDCGTSRYALARQIGVSESTLSRFLSGERGLTLSVLDRLADVLGLRVVVTVQKARQPSRRGPKKKLGEQKVKKAIGNTKVSWESLARACAKDAAENFFESRRGMWHLEGLDVLCLYNNNPYAQYPTLRDEETAQLREWLKKKGIKELAYATYPEAGEDAGYTFAMILDASSDRENEIRNAYQEITCQIFARLK